MEKETSELIKLGIYAFVAVTVMMSVYAFSTGALLAL